MRYSFFNKGQLSSKYRIVWQKVCIPQSLTNILAQNWIALDYLLQNNVCHSSRYIYGISHLLHKVGHGGAEKVVGGVLWKIEGSGNVGLGVMQGVGVHWCNIAIRGV